MYMSNVLPMVRTTHYRDIVPHHPTMVMGFTHVTTEWYEDDTGALQQYSQIFTRTVLYCTVLYCTVQYTISQFNTTLYYTTNTITFSII